MTKEEAEQIFYYLQLNLNYSSECQECAALTEENKGHVMDLLLKFKPDAEPLPVKVGYTEKDHHGRRVVWLKFNNGTEIKCLWSIDGSFNVEETGKNIQQAIALHEDSVVIEK